MKRFQWRSTTADLLIKIIIVIIVSFIVLFVFNFLISGTIYAVDFWSMISSVVTTILALVALIIFLRNVIINNIYEACRDFVGNEFYNSILPNDKKLIEKYKELEIKFKDVKDDERYVHNSGYMKELDVLYRECYINAFKDYLEEMWWLGKFVLKLHGFIITGDYSLHMEYMKAFRKDWFEGN